MNNQYQYNEYIMDPMNDFTEEEWRQYLANQNANQTARKINNLRRRATSKRIGKFLGRQPGTRSMIARAKSRRKEQNRNKSIRNSVAAARSKFKANVNNTANLAYGTNANFNQRTQNIGDLFGNQYENALMDIMTNKAGKNSFKESAVQQIRQSFKNSALAENARLYQEAKNVLFSEPQQHRQTVLKIAALDDLMAEEKMRLSLANNDGKAMDAATKLYNINVLKEELDEARHASKVPTPEQNARYAALVAGVNFDAMNTSLYKRLVANNAAQTGKNVAATKIQAVVRGKRNRKLAKTLRARRNINRLAAQLPANAPMIPNLAPPKPQGQVLGGPAVALTPAQLRAARLAALTRKQ
jgi:hypothetical protein